VKQRVHLRKTITLGATIMASGYTPKPCTIRDYSETGMYIACKKSLVHGQVLDPLMVGEHHNMVSGDILDIQLLVPISAKTRSYNLNVEVVRCFEESIGVRYLGSCEPAIEALQLLSDQLIRQKQAEASFSMHQHVLDLSAISQCQKLVRDHLEPLLIHNLDSFERCALQYADTSTSNLKKSLFVNAVDELRLNQHAIQGELIQNVEIELARLGHKNTVSETSQAQQDSIHKSVCKELDKVVFDDWLSTTDLIHKAEKECEIPLIDLNHRIGDLLGRDINNENNPIGPSFLCHEFYAQVVTMSLGKQVLTMVFDVFYRQVLSKLHTLYDSLSSLLIRAGTTSAQEGYITGPPTLHDRTS